MARKRLTDLYVLGKTIEFEDADGYESVYIRKLQQFEVEKAMARANRERAKFLTIARSPESEDYQVIMEELITACPDKDSLINIVAGEELTKAFKSSESEIAHQDKWSEDDYIDGLQEAWLELEEHAFIEDDEVKHSEAQRVFEQLKLYYAEVEKSFEKKKKRIIRDENQKSMAELREEAIKKYLEIKGDHRWVEEYKACVVWLCVRPSEKEKSVYYFEKREEIDQLNEVIYNKIQDTYQDLLVVPEEGKD